MSCSRHTINLLLGYTKYYQYTLRFDSLWLNDYIILILNVIKLQFVNTSQGLE